MVVSGVIVAGVIVAGVIVVAHGIGHVTVTSFVPSGKVASA
jgi:hypothetical protein